ncbi:MFS transporter [Microbacterium sp.]|uniref:MFS transporter n=1 Tax=Microbacterium sp. TaxID=51671 RepID=UPI002734BC96|nr:MFS transporter [Microbacterium sp.]MDP3949357.1 MFS transporter [Microbacterium sp.]
MSEEPQFVGRGPTLGAPDGELSAPPATPSERASARFEGFVVLFMAVAAALGTSAIYVLQPAVGEVAQSLGTTVAAIGVALAWGPIGYMVGLVALVPLVDRFAPGRVLAVQFGVLAVSLGVSAMVHSVPLLAALVAITGACSVVGAGMSSLTGKLASPRRRASTLGIVTAGISVGILAGRIIGGMLTEALGWQNMLFCFAAAGAVLAACCLLLIPSPPRTTRPRGYFTSIRSIPGLFVRHAALRLAAIRGALWFFAFCAVWAGLAVVLVQPPFSQSPEQVGLYALAGLSGLVATQIAGRWTDRVGARRVVVAGLTLALLAAIVLGFVLPNMAATMICLALFDAGLFAAQVANQSTVLSIDPSSPARFNSGYMVVYFIGGSLGTAFGSAAIEWYGWTLTTVISATLVFAAIALTLARTSDTPKGGRRANTVMS